VRGDSSSVLDEANRHGLTAALSSRQVCMRHGRYLLAVPLTLKSGMSRFVTQMASEQQFEFFKSLYEAESRRAGVLAEHAKNNLGLATLYSAFILFVVEKQIVVTSLSKALFIATVLCMLMAFLLSLWATQVANYEACTVPKDVFAFYGDKPPTDEEFFDDRIVDYSVASERNSLVNDKKARQLLFARYFLLLGVTLHASYFVARLF
jgi:hypothetical protein